MSLQSYTAMRSRQTKEEHPERYCPARNCLWRTGGGWCPRHGGEARNAAETAARLWSFEEHYGRPYTKAPQEQQAIVARAHEIGGAYDLSRGWIMKRSEA